MLVRSTDEPHHQLWCRYLILAPMTFCVGRCHQTVIPPSSNAAMVRSSNPLIETRMKRPNQPRASLLVSLSIVSVLGVAACTTPAAATPPAATSTPAASGMMHESPSPAASGMMHESPSPADSGMMHESPSPADSGMMHASPSPSTP